MALYRNEDYTNKTIQDDYHLPEILIFDWDGNYITGFKMDRAINMIEYDEIHKILYGINGDEELYAYDMEKIMP